MRLSQPPLNRRPSGQLPTRRQIASLRSLQGGWTRWLVALFGVLTLLTSAALGEAPVLDLDGNDSSGVVGGHFQTTWVQGGGSVTLADGDATLVDIDSPTLTSVGVSFANRPDGTNEVLSAVTTGTLITATYDADTGVLSLTGAASPASYQQVLRGILYNNTADQPTGSTRVLEIMASDGPAATERSTVLLVQLTGQTLRASYTPAFTSLADDGYELRADQPWGQTFRHTSGSGSYSVRKVGVVLTAASDAPANATLTISLRSTWGGANLASATLSVAAIATAEAWYEFSLGPVTLIDGLDYLVRVDSTSFDGKVYLGVDDVGSYSSGDLINLDGNAEAGKDAAFRILSVISNAAPTISSIANQTTAEDTAIGPIAFTIGDDLTAAASLVVTGTSGNTNLIPHSGIVLGGSGTNRTVTLTPAANQHGGPATITLTVSDGSLTATNQFTLTVTGANDIPTLSGLDGDTLDYTEGDGAVFVEQDGDALVEDVDARDFDGGTLTVSITSGGENAEDQLGIRNQGADAGQIGVGGFGVAYQGTLIGSLSGGAHGEALVIGWNSNATPEAASALIRNITYRNGKAEAPSSGTRNLRFIVTDGDGGTSAAHNLTVEVRAINSAPSFSSATGMLRSEPTLYDRASGVALQQDGKLLVTGSGRNSSFNRDFLLLRYNTDGSLDTNFNGTGVVLTDFSASIDLAQAVAVQADGKILVGGIASVGNYSTFGLARYLSNGVPDSGFNSTGKITTALTTNVDCSAYDLVVQADGRIVLAGNTRNGSGGSNLALVRYHPNGTLDTSFGGTGKVSIDLGSGYDTGNAIALQADGKLLVAGNRTAGNSNEMAVARLNTNGSLDTGFNTNGYRTVRMGSDSTATAIAVQTNGSIVVGGYGRGAVYYDFAVFRLLPNGSLDTSFNGTGQKTASLSPTTDQIEALTIQSDGSIVAAGTAELDGDYDFAVARFLSNGTLDTTFQGTGTVTTAISTPSDTAFDILQQPDGKLVAVGESIDFGFGAVPSRIGMVRYTSEGALDTTFGTAATTLDGVSAHTEGGEVSLLDADVTVVDPELSTADEFEGASIALRRQGTADAADQFHATGLLGALTEGDDLTYNGTSVGTVTTHSDGTLVLSFGQGTTAAQVNGILQAIGYTYSGDAPPTTVPIDWTFQDGNTGAQGDGGALSISGSSVVNITAVDDPPTASDGQVTGVENVAHVFAWAEFQVTDPDSPITTNTAIQIQTLPDDGRLEVFDGTHWEPATLLQTVTQSSMDAGGFRFVPDAQESGHDGYANPGVGHLFQDYALFDFAPVQPDAPGDPGPDSTLTIDLTPVADTPSVTDASTSAETQTTSGLVIARNPADGAEVTHFQITSITHGTLFQNDGVSVITNGTFITSTEGQAGLRFTPETVFAGDAGFSVQASTSNAASGLGGDTVHATITVTPRDQTITFLAIPDQEPSGSLVLSATATSGLAVTFGVSSGPASITHSNQLTFTGAGSVTITASQPGNAAWNPAPDVSRSFLVNTVPLPASPTLERWPLGGVKVRTTNLLGTDADGDAIVLLSAGPTTFHGGTVSTNAAWVFYLPSTGFTQADSFAYVVADAQGATNSGTATIVLTTDDAPTPNYSVIDLGGGTARVGFSAIPGRSYAVQYADSLTPPDWQDLTVETADDTGRIQVTDSEPGQPNSRHYRLVHVQP